MTDLFILGLAVVAVLFASRRGLVAGYPLALGLMVFLPDTLRLELPGIWPEVTVHRLIMLVLFVRWALAPAESERAPTTRLLGVVLALLLASRAISTAFSITPAPSLKDLLSFAIETVLFTHLSVAALPTLAAARAALRALGVAATAVAAVALVERYTGVSLPAVTLAGFKHCHDGIQSTFPHRILLGYAMAVALPINLQLFALAQTRAGRLAWGGATLAVITACFLADSRGGWLGMALAGATVFALGPRPVRRACVVLAALAALTLLLRPGIRDTITARITDTYAGDSYKAVSYRYRWLLWDVAFAEIDRTPERFLFGYGGLSTESMDLSHYFHEQQGGMTLKTGFTSWDNHYASDLMEFGVVGLGLEVLGYLALVLQLVLARRHAPPAYRDLLTVALIGTAVLLFARTNVYLFGQQPKLLAWALIALGAAANRTPATAPAATAPRAVPVFS